LLINFLLHLTQLLASANQLILYSLSFFELLEELLLSFRDIELLTVLLQEFAPSFFELHLQILYSSLKLANADFFLIFFKALSTSLLLGALFITKGLDAACGFLGIHI